MASFSDRDASALMLLDPARRAAIDRLAASVHRAPADVLNEAVDAYLALDRHHRKRIIAGLREADARDFAGAEEVAAAFDQ